MAKPRTYPVRTLSASEILCRVHQAERGVIDARDEIAFRTERLGDWPNNRMLQDDASRALRQAEQVLVARIAERDQLVAKHGTVETLRAAVQD